MKILKFGQRYKEASKLLGPRMNEIYSKAYNESKKLPSDIEAFLACENSLHKVFGKLYEATYHCWVYLEDKAFANKRRKSISRNIRFAFFIVVAATSGAVCLNCYVFVFVVVLL